MQVVAAPGSVGDIRGSFTATTPEGEEGSKMKELISIIMNNEVDVNKSDDKGVSHLHDAIKVGMTVDH